MPSCRADLLTRQQLTSISYSRIACQTLGSRRTYVLTVFNGLRGIYAAAATLLDVLLPLGYASALILWILADARCLERPLPLTGRTWMFLFLSVSIIPYLFWARRWRGLALVGAHGLGLLILNVGVTLLGGYLLFGTGWLAVACPGSSTVADPGHAALWPGHPGCCPAPRLISGTSISRTYPDAIVPNRK